MALSVPSNATVEGQALVERDAEVASQQIARARRDQPERNLAAGQPGADDADGAVAADAQHQVDALRQRALRHGPAGSVGDVSSHSGGCQPRLLSSYSIRRRKVDQSVILIGL